MLMVLAALLLLLIALLAIPLTLTFKVSWQDALEKDIVLQWAFGLIRIDAASWQSKAGASEGEKAEPKRSDSPRPRRKKPNVFAMLRQSSFRRRITKFIGDLWRAVKKQDLELHARIGLGDPADTGQLWAVVGPISGILSSIQQASLTVEPEFSDATLEINTSGRIQLIPLQILYLTSALLLSPPIWRGIRQMRATG